MSNNTLVVSVTKTLIAPFVPAGTIAAFATIVPSESFNVETFGIGWPVGQVVRFPSGAPVTTGTTVKFNEYAGAVDGMPQELAGMLKVREDWAAIAGGPYAPENPAPVR